MVPESSFGATQGDRCFSLSDLQMAVVPSLDCVRSTEHAYHMTSVNTPTTMVLLERLTANHSIGLDYLCCMTDKPTLLKAL